MGMPVSPARIREIRKQLDDAARDLEGDDQYAELADIVTAAADGFDQMTNERGQIVEAPAVQVGSRVKREADPDEAGGDNADPDALGLDEPDDPDMPPAKRKMPPQFRR